jgi:hypothetical protein
VQKLAHRVRLGANVNQRVQRFGKNWLISQKFGGLAESFSMNTDNYCPKERRRRFGSWRGPLARMLFSP